MDETNNNNNNNGQLTNHLWAYNANSITQYTKNQTWENKSEAYKFKNYLLLILSN